jgi:hypothetical protein
VFNKIINKYVYPVICNQWQEHKNANINSIMSSDLPIWLAGDGQFDSPEFCAKYCTYFVMDIHSGKIVDFKLVQKGQIKGDLERQACEQLLTELKMYMIVKLSCYLQIDTKEFVNISEHNIQKLRTNLIHGI